MGFHVVAHGTLTDGAHTYAYERLASDAKHELTSPSGSFGCEQDLPCRGAYRIHLPNVQLLVGFDDDWLPTRSTAEHGAIVHEQLHIAGTQYETIAIRRGRLVLLSIYDEQRRNDWVDDRRFDNPPLLATFVPKLADHIAFTVLALPP